MSSTVRTRKTVQLQLARTTFKESDTVLNTIRRAASKGHEAVATGCTDPFLRGVLLGRGGMGSVYRAVQTSLGRDVAVKVLDRERVEVERARELFVAEGLAAAQLQHPNIIPIHELGTETDGTPFLAMKLIGG